MSMKLHTLPAYAPVAAAALFLPRTWTGRVAGACAPSLGRRFAPAANPRRLANYGRFLADFMHAAWRGQRGIESIVPRVEGLSGLRMWEGPLCPDRPARGRGTEAPPTGILFVSAHLGQWELGGFRLGSLGLPFTAVAARRGSAGMQGLRAWGRRKFGMDTLPVREDGSEPEAFHALAARLRTGGRIGMLIDHRDPATGRTAFSRAPVLLQRRSGAAIVPFACLLDPDGSYTLHLAEPIPPGPEAGDKVETVLRNWITEHPDQHYLWI